MMENDHNATMLKYKADIRTILFQIIITTLLFGQWFAPVDEFPAWSVAEVLGLALFWPAFAAAMFMGVTVSVMAHNINHVPMYRSGALNKLTDYWLTVFYGFPAFAWIPTHNLNHHKLNNRPGDYTTTWRYTEANNLLTLVTYPTLSGLRQQTPTREYLVKLWKEYKPKFWYCVSQYVALIAAYGLALALDWRKALFFLVLPGQFGLYMVLIFNYIQHIHADEESEYNHSRNFTNPLLNFWLLNNGYHTIHHLKMGQHWSLNKADHFEIEKRIDPRLNERSFFWYIFRQYFLAPVVPKLATYNMRMARIEGHPVAPQTGAA